MIKMLAGEACPARRRHPAEERVVRPFTLLATGTEPIEQFAQRLDVGLPASWLRREGFSRPLGAMWPWHDVDDKPSHWPISKRSPHWTSGEFSEREAQLVGQVTDHLRSGNGAPLSLAARLEPIDSALEALASVRHEHRGHGRTLPLMPKVATEMSYSVATFVRPSADALDGYTPGTG